MKNLIKEFDALKILMGSNFHKTKQLIEILEIETLEDVIDVYIAKTTLDAINAPSEIGENIEYQDKKAICDIKKNAMYVSSKFMTLNFYREKLKYSEKNKSENKLILNEDDFDSLSEQEQSEILS